MNEEYLLNRLDKNFVFIMDFSSSFRRNMATFTNDNGYTFKLWLHKLCVDPYDTIAMKRLRNAYASKMLTCLSMGQLTLPFTRMPQLGPLKSISIKTAVDPEPEWLKEFVSAKDENVAANCKTYMASNVLDNGKGACAYVAVSMKDSVRTEPQLNINGATGLMQNQRSKNK